MKTAVRVLLGGLFILSGFSKAVYPPQAFAAALEAYRLFPDAWLMPIALALPWLELILGAFLFCGYFTRLSAAGLGALIVGFLISLGSVMARKVDLYSCGCYGRWGPKFTPGQAFLFDLFLLGGAFFLARRPQTSLGLDAWLNQRDAAER